MLYKWGIQTVFYDDCKWSTTFKDCELPYSTPVTYIILYISYASLKNG